MDKTRNRASGAAVWISLCLVTSGEAHAQIAPPECEECEPFEARYAPRAIALLARISQPDSLPKRLWYLENSASHGLGVLSWNSHGQIVGTRFRSALGVSPEAPRGFVWLPQPAYNLTAQQPHDLFALAHPADEDSPSYCWDISDEGLVVGSAGALAEQPDGSARAWDLTKILATFVGQPAELEIDFGHGDAAWTIALAVTPTSLSSQSSRILGAARGRCDGWREPFEFFQTVPPSAVLIPHLEPPRSQLGLLENHSRRKWACDIASHSSDPVGSFDQPEYLEDPETSECQEWCEDTTPSTCADHCDGPMIAGADYPSDPNLVTQFYRVGENLSSSIGLPDQPTGIRSSSRVVEAGIDVAPVLAGYHLTSTSAGGGCPQRAALWTYDITHPLRNELPSALARTESGSLYLPIAQRWRGIDCICEGEAVLGWQVGRAGAFWTTSRDPNSTETFQAHAVTELLNGIPTSIVVEQLYDILPTGEILALVRRQLDIDHFNIFAAILGLAGDLDGDRSVGAADLAVLLANWGAEFVGDEPQLAADMDLDLTVNAADLAMLLTQWRSGPIRLLLPADGIVPSAPPTGRALCMLLPDEVCALAQPNFKTDTRRLHDCLCCALGAFGFESADAFAAWARLANPPEVEITCCCIKAMMNQLVNEEAEHE